MKAIYDYSLDKISLNKQLQFFFEEDDLSRNFHYTHSLPVEMVDCTLKIKSDLVMAGLPFFLECFDFLGAKLDVAIKSQWMEHEGKRLEKNQEIQNLTLPFNLALSAERVALNLLQRASSIATTTAFYVQKVCESKLPITIIDTRKTTPGLRVLEKYAVRVGGGHNHRLGQTDLWMIKDNHKKFFGGLKASLQFFKSQGSFYNPIVAEIHNLQELEEAFKLKINHLMLDNFSPEMIKKAVALKESGVTYEVSGGVNQGNIESYLIEGVDAISIGHITSSPQIVDISFKYQKAK